MNVVDSGGWLEYFAGGKNADFFAEAVENTGDLVVPTISLHEVFKRILQQRTDYEAFHVIAVMRQGRIAVLDNSLALSSARLSLEYRLPMADSVMLATAFEYDAILWTQDSHFEGLRGVKYVLA